MCRVHKLLNHPTVRSVSHRHFQDLIEHLLTELNGICDLVSALLIVKGPRMGLPLAIEFIDLRGVTHLTFSVIAEGVGYRLRETLVFEACTFKEF
jgi:hypothetical protein